MSKDFVALLDALRATPLTRDEWVALDLVLRAIWRERFEGIERFPVRL